MDMQSSPAWSDGSARDYNPGACSSGVSPCDHGVDAPYAHFYRNGNWGTHCNTCTAEGVCERANPDKTYTDSLVDGQCYKAGNACPEAHAVCDASYCEMDVWKSLIADFKAAGTVTVLGSVDASTTTSQYSDLAMDGFYFTDAVESGYGGTSVLALGSPLFDDTLVDAATVYVTLASSDLGIWNPFSWYPSVSPLKWAAIVTDAADVSAAATLFDRGYGYVYLTSESGLETKSTIMTSLIAEIEGTATRRKLQSRRLQADKPCWDAPMDQCACKCFHEAQWTCEGESVVCK